MKKRRRGPWTVALLVALASMGATASVAHAGDWQEAHLMDSKTYYKDGRAIAEVGPTTASCYRPTRPYSWLCTIKTSVRDRTQDGYSARVRIAILDGFQDRVIDYSAYNGETSFKYVSWVLEAKTPTDLWRLSRWVGRSNGTQGIWTPYDLFNFWTE